MPRDTTLDRTLLPGDADPSGYRRLTVAPGEPTVERRDLYGGPRDRSRPRTTLVAFAHLTDHHLTDAQSPARVEFLDRFDPRPWTDAGDPPFAGSYRPWEMLSAHVAEAMVQAVNGVGAGPVTGRPLDFAISTGDNADNTQHDEVRWHIDLLDGGSTVRPDSGSDERWEGVGAADDDPQVWHPDGIVPDEFVGRYGFPVVPGLLDRCRAPFTATGLRVPWYSVFGNHDGLLQGVARATEESAAVAVGASKVVDLPTDPDVSALAGDAAADADRSGLHLLLTQGPTRDVTADAGRRQLDRAAVVREHFVTTGSPVGHGYTEENLERGTAYYRFDAGSVRCIVLDTVNPRGHENGSIDSAQLDWLAATLDASARRPVIVFSHHTVATMDNLLGGDRVDGTTITRLLLQHPNVIAWVNGHTHANAIHAHRRSPDTHGGFWEITTASHVDWPQQSRVVEIVDNGDGSLSIVTTVLDHAAPTGWARDPSTPLELAALSRELASNDPLWPAASARGAERRGGPSDRNVELVLPGF